MVPPPIQSASMRIIKKYWAINFNISKKKIVKWIWIDVFTRWCGFFDVFADNAVDFIVSVGTVDDDGDVFADNTVVDSVVFGFVVIDFVAVDFVVSVYNVAVLAVVDSVVIDLYVYRRTNITKLSFFKHISFFSITSRFKNELLDGKTTAKLIFTAATVVEWRIITVITIELSNAKSI